jgi:hypothetical protein
MKHKLTVIAFLLIFCILFTACVPAATPAPLPTEVPATEVPTEAPTATALPTETLVPTATQAPTDTATPEPTATAVPTETPVPADTDTPLPPKVAPSKTPLPNAECYSNCGTFEVDNDTDGNVALSIWGQGGEANWQLKKGTNSFNINPGLYRYWIEAGCGTLNETFTVKEGQTISIRFYCN